MPMARSDRALAPTEAAGPRSEGAGARVTVFEVAIARCHAGPRVIVRAGWRSATCAKGRSEEHTSELQSLMRISYAVFCLKKKKTQTNNEQANVDTCQRDKKPHK